MSDVWAAGPALATDVWVTASALATAAGTLVLAIATFSSVRVSNRSAKASERALQAQIRPVLVSSRLQDPEIKVGFQDIHWVRVQGGRAVADATDDAIYLAMGVRNVGNGIAVLDRWDFYPERPIGTSGHRDPASFYRTTRDIYVPPADNGFWQGTFREPSDPSFAAAAKVINAREPFTIDLLYSDTEGGQHTISRFSIQPVGEDGWITAVSRHWNLDRHDPR